MTPGRKNKSGVKGVHWSKCAKKWRAYAYFGGEPFHVGLFDKIEDAAKAYQDFIQNKQRKAA